MNRRYLVAKALGQEALEETVAEDEHLLHQFGLKLLSVDPGVRAAVMAEVRKGIIHPWNVLEINNKTWDWLRPLLVELLQRRGGCEDASGEGTVYALAAKN